MSGSSEEIAKVRDEMFPSGYSDYIQTILRENSEQARPLKKAISSNNLNAFNTAFNDAVTDDMIESIIVVLASMYVNVGNTPERRRMLLAAVGKYSKDRKRLLAIVYHTPFEDELREAIELVEKRNTMKRKMVENNASPKLNPDTNYAIKRFIGRSRRKRVRKSKKTQKRFSRL